MNRFMLMCLAVMAVCALFTVQATAGPPTSSSDEVKCDTSCPIATSAPAIEDCAIDFATCVVDQPSECNISNPAGIEDTNTTDIASSAARQSESDHGAIPQVNGTIEVINVGTSIPVVGLSSSDHNAVSKVVGTIEVINVGTSISNAVLFAGHYYPKADFSTRYKKEVSKRIICMVQMDTDSNSPQVETS